MQVDNYHKEWNKNCAKGIIDAIVDIGKKMEYYSKDNIELADGGVEAMTDTIDDMTGGLIEISIPDEYAEKYLGQEGRCNSYLYTLMILRSIINFQPM